MKKYIPILYAIDKLIKEGKISRFEKEELQTYVKYSLCGRKMFNARVGFGHGLRHSQNLPKGACPSTR